MTRLSVLSASPSPTGSTNGSDGALALAHGIHYGIVAAGVVGILALLVPQLHERLVGPHHSRVRAPRDQHEARVMLLRAEIASGAIGTAIDRRPTALLERPTPAPELPHTARVLLPAAFVASTAAAGVHAAMGPSHLQESGWFGAFFGLSALFQLGWSGAVVVRASRTVLLCGALANAAFVALWALTRTVGLPVLLPQPEAVGPWDLSCVAWELVVVAACLRLLGADRAPTQLAPWHRWDSTVTVFAVGSVTLLAALSFSGFSG